MTETNDHNTEIDNLQEEQEDELGLPKAGDDDDDEELNIDQILAEHGIKDEDDQDIADTDQKTEENTENKDGIDVEKLSKNSELETDENSTNALKGGDSQEILDEVNRFLNNELGQFGDSGLIDSANINNASEFVAEIHNDENTDENKEDVDEGKEKVEDSIPAEEDELVLEVSKQEGEEETKEENEEANSEEILVNSSPKQAKSSGNEENQQISDKDEDIIFDPKNDPYVLLIYPPNRKSKQAISTISEKPTAKKSNIPRCFSVTQKKREQQAEEQQLQDEDDSSLNQTQTLDKKSVGQAPISAKSSNLANERNERLIRGAVGPRKLLTKMQAETALSLFNISGSAALKIVNQCSVSGGKVSADNIIQFLLSNTDPNIHTPVSVLVKSALTNMRNTVLSPRKK
ncbi:hypothetical protein TVAG_194780 [Trichomonas vaginalis G3]|uniref:Uncharacterized protein n=1 Tax=Trichomonas vaginalis (strain ATCC PRA-98 / G3) TaxID=412133 RepID=A2FL21_TRIV3|nr:hypothetical protein TVAGG3_1047640 [Trichomonas vaginalis G3]EAX94392.1 hypothetical protein TVAG_194780 [Trichomonas vaginalis G3]KAI5493994.1 hypothetical protein TVAGG3_1047640 [Trichomonas vaginalis G3]|eukprot:XP_001307322.1 hypothetical protein [Trichomonas vaginalis G3]